MNVGFAQDYLTWTNTESVTWTSTRGTGSMVATILNNVKVRAVSQREIVPSNGAYAAGDVWFLLPAALLDNGPPKPGDWLATFDDARHIVLEVDGQRRDSVGGYSTWRCRGRNRAVAADLADSITIEESVLDLDPARVETRGWKRRYSGLIGKVQKLREAQAEAFRLRGFEGDYAVYLEQEANVDRTCRIPWSGALSGYLEVGGYHPAASLEQLPTIDAKAMP